MGCLSEINVYPVKSCKAVSLKAALLTPAGMLFDRQWAVVRAENGKFLSQRQIPKMALIEASLPLELYTSTSVADACAGVPSAVLTLRVPEAQPVAVPLLPETSQQLRTVTVWEWTGMAADEGDSVASYLSAYLGVEVRLVRYIGSKAHQQRMGLAPASGASGASDAAARLANPEYAGSGAETSFADGYPILLTSEASMEDLNTRMGEPLGVNRFRGNLVMAGEAPWVEDGWRQVEVLPKEGSIRLDNVKPCDRCKVPTIEQETAVVGDEPLKSLSSYRTGAILGWAENKKSWTHSVFFGVNLVPQGTGVVRVGDVIQPIAA